MIEGQAKAVEKEITTAATIAENIDVPANLPAETGSAKALEVKVRKIYQLNRKKRIGKMKSSRIL